MILRHLHNTRFIHFGVAAVIGLLAVGAIIVVYRNARVNVQTSIMTFGVNDTASLNSEIAITEGSLEEERVSAPQLIEGTHYRYLSGGSMHWEWRPAWKLSHAESLTTSLEVSDPVGMLVARTGSSDGILPNELPLYIPGMENMQETSITSTKTHRTLHVYTADNLDQPSSDQSLESWLGAHETTPTMMTNDVAGDIDWDKLQQPLPEATATTTLDGKLYGNGSFLIAAPQHLTISLLKTNLNLSRVDDSATLLLHDEAGKVVASTTISSDGIENGKRSTTTQQVEWEPQLPKPGLYIFSILKNDNSSHPFFSNLTFNTPYVALKEGIVKTDGPISTTLANSNIPVNVRLVENPGTTQIHFSGEQSFSYASDGHDLVTDHITAPVPGTYSFSYAGRIELTDGLYTLPGATAFSPYRIAQTIQDPQIIVTGITLTHKTDTTLELSNTWSQHALRTMVIDEKTEAVTFELAEVHTEQPALFTTALSSYTHLWTGCGISLFSRNEFPSNAFTDRGCSDAAELPSILRSMIPLNSTLTSLSALPGISELLGGYSGVDNFISGTQTITARLHGDHRFAVFAPNGLDLSVETTNMNRSPGSDEVSIDIFTAQGERIASTIIPDDENISDDGYLSEPLLAHLHVGSTDSPIYIVDIQAQDPERQDYLITGMTVNTNKLVTLNHIWTQNSTELFTSLATITQVDLYAASAASKRDDDDVVLDRDTDHEERIAFSQENDYVNTSILLNRGQHTIHTGTTQMQMTGFDAAFTTNGFFTYGPYRIGEEALVIDEEHWGETKLYNLSLTYAR